MFKWFIKILRSLFPKKDKHPETKKEPSVKPESSGSDYKLPNLRRAMNDMSHTLECLNRVHKPSGMTHMSSPEMEAFLATVGPTWIPREIGFTRNPDYFSLSDMPSIGAVAMSSASDNWKSDNPDDKVFPQFFCWMCWRNRRYPGIEVAKSNERIVETWVMFEGDGKKNRFWFNNILAIDRDSGEARCLKIIQENQAPNGGLQRQFKRQRGVDGKYIDAEEEKGWLCWAVNAWFQRDIGWQVEMSKGRRKLTFGIPNNEARRWFRRRLTATTTDGRRKRILHEVISHYRKTKNGTTTVKPHLRGEREFWWNGCKTRINISAKDMRLLTKFRGEADSHDESSEDGVSAYSLGKALRDGEMPHEEKQRETA